MLCHFYDRRLSYLGSDVACCYNYLKNFICNSQSVNIKNDAGCDFKYAFELRFSDSFLILVWLLLLLFFFFFFLSFCFFFFSFFLASTATFALAFTVALASPVLLGLPHQYLVLLLSFFACCILQKVLKLFVQYISKINYCTFNAQFQIIFDQSKLLWF